MYTESFKQQITGTLSELENQGLFKKERVIASPQGGRDHSC